MRLHARILVTMVAATTLACVVVLSGRPQAAAEEAALRATQAQFAAAWAKADAHAVAALFGPDADLIIPTGLVMRGQLEIEAFYRGVFAQGYAGSQAGSEISRIRFLKPDLAVVDATWFIRGAHDKSGSAAAEESGTLVLVAMKSAQGWRIAALRESASAKSFRALADTVKQQAD
jgi:uncharacterized protein (TIGR02246 family)